MFLQMFTLICVHVTLQVVYYQIKIKLNLTMISNIYEKLFSGVMSGLMAVVLSFYAIDTRFDVYIGLGITSLLIGLIYSGGLTFFIAYAMYGLWLYAFPYIHTMYSLETYIIIGLVLFSVSYLVKHRRIYIKGSVSVITYALLSGIFAYFDSGDFSFALSFVAMYLILAAISLFAGIAIITYMQNYVRMFEAAEFEAGHDGLTGLLNRRHFNQCMKELDPQLPVSLIMLDIDKFKSINDIYGHSTGDAVLQKIAETIKNTVIEDRSIARIGGEEFAIILRKYTLEEAKIIAEKLRTAIEDTTIENKEAGLTLKVTVSLGLASYPEQTNSIGKLYDLADKRLYFSKKLGRNQLHYDTPATFTAELK